MRPAGPEERHRIDERFAALCRIASPSWREGEVAAAVAGELRSLGLPVEEDDAGAAGGGEQGNLLVRVPGRGPGSVLLCAHLDTVPPTAPIEPVLGEDRVWRNVHDGILGADNKAAVAVMVEVVRRAVAEPPPVGVELLLTVAEEVALAGAAAFDVGRVRSPFGYVFDHATPIGGVVVASPTYYRLEAEFHGRAAHAGIRPEDGRNAIAAAARAVAGMPLGRLDAGTTANVGRIDGGVEGTNVVAERCRVLLETRSLDAARAEAVVADLVGALHDGANAGHCDVDVDVACLFRGYRTPGTAPEIVAAEAALRRCGHEPERLATGGGSDANAFIANGLPCVNLANGTEANHEPTESVPEAALHGMFDVALALVDEAAAVQPDGPGGG